VSAQIFDALSHQPVLPLLTPAAAESGLAAARALNAGGIPMVEVAQRTPASLECLITIADEAPELVVGAGTVVSADQAIACIDAGARFIVSPGLDEAVIEACRSMDVAVIPGIMTPTELQHAHRLGLGVVKFFPASTAGGVEAVRALAAVFGTMRFIPTGGISARNLADYLAVGSVLACGGSWMTPDDAVAGGDFARVTALATAALSIAQQARGS
jgi:2-dehydro-3-deoxyphosphogluconate aldolase/(4S)-4-hydroxy-2-oxoglutarate aldolase